MLTDSPPPSPATGTSGQITQLLDPAMFERFKDLDQVRRRNGVGGGDVGGSGPDVVWEDGSR